MFCYLQKEFKLTIAFCVGKQNSKVERLSHSSNTSNYIFVEVLVAVAVVKQALGVDKGSYANSYFLYILDTPIRFKTCEIQCKK